MEVREGPVAVRTSRRARRIVFLDDPAHPINGDVETRRAYLRKRKSNHWAELNPEQRREYDRRRTARRTAERAERLTVEGGPPPPARRGGPAPRTIAQQAAVHAYKLGYRITDAGEVRNPAGQLVATPPRGERGARVLTVYAPLPEGRKRRGVRSGKGPVAIPLGTFAALCRYGAAAFATGACLVYLNGDHTDLSRGNAVLADRSAVGHQRERMRAERGERRVADWRAPIAQLMGRQPATSRRKLEYAAVLQYRRRWNRGVRGQGESIEALAREAGIDPRAMGMALRGETYREEQYRPLRTRRRRSVDDTTIRAFRLAVQERGVTVREAVKRLGKTERWGYYVLAGKLYPTVNVTAIGATA